MLLYSFEFKFHSVANNISKIKGSNHVNAYQPELSMNVDPRPCNMAPDGNNIFPRNLSVNVKKVSGIFLMTLWQANQLAQMYTRSHTSITSRVKGSHHFRSQNGPKKIVYGKIIFNGEIYFSCSPSPLSWCKSWQWPKVKLGQSNKR